MSETKHSPPPIPEHESTEPEKKFDLSATQIAGGALAAMTAAYLGSRMSVAGTVIGAAIASIVAGVAGSVYTASLRHTRDKVKSVWTGRTDTTPTEIVVTREGAPGALQGPTAAATAPPLTANDEAAAAVTDRYETRNGQDRTARSVPLWRTGRFWKRMAIGAVATFALAAAAITGLELVSGQALGGGEGTTLQHVRQSQSDAPSQAPSEKSSDSPSSSPSEQPSAAPSDEPSSEQSAEASESTQPSEAPSPAGGDGETSTAPESSEKPSTTGGETDTEAGSEAGADANAAG